MRVTIPKQTSSHKYDIVCSPKATTVNFNCKITFHLKLFAPEEIGFPSQKNIYTLVRINVFIHSFMYMGMCVSANQVSTVYNL